MSDEITKIRDLTIKIRKNILTLSLAAGASSSHFGGSLSTVELLATLYNSILKHDPSNPLWDERDRFILSKGHACLGYYSVLCEKGYFSKEDLNLFEKNDSYLLGHPVINKNKGIEFSNGSLGMSWSTRNPVSIDLMSKLPATFELVLFSLLVTVGFSIPLGIISAVKKDTIIDHLSRIFVLSGVSIPNFWLGLILIFLVGSSPAASGSAC